MLSTRNMNIVVFAVHRFDEINFAFPKILFFDYYTRDE